VGAVETSEQPQSSIISTRSAANIDFLIISTSFTASLYEKKPMSSKVQTDLRDIADILFSDSLGSDDRVKAVADICREKQIPIRIGVNSGSLEKHILAKYGAPTPEAMVESAMYHAALLEKFDFNDIVISIKSSNVPTMIAAYEMAAQRGEGLSNRLEQLGLVAFDGQ
jgi:4-hydroxy-3-methylbut-2-en-1-yl diphosphate synthase IspG/GcpE